MTIRFCDNFKVLVMCNVNVNVMAQKVSVMFSVSSSKMVKKYMDNTILPVT